MRPTLLRRLLGVFVLSPVLTSQAVQWQLPPGCAVHYKRKVQEEGTHTRPGRKPQRCSLLEDGYTPTLFFQGELDPKQTHLAQPVFFFDELVLHLATDLRHVNRAGERVLETPATAYLLPYRVTAEYAAAKDGRQKIRASVRSFGAQPQRSPGWEMTVDATLEIRRTVDIAAGRVTSFDSDGRFVFVDEKNKERRELRRKEAWVLSHLEVRDARFEARVAEAVKRGVQALHKRLETPLRDRGWSLGPRPADRPVRDWYGPGYRALLALTLIKGGVDRKDPLLLELLDDLRKLEITESYSLSMAIMAMEAYYAPADEGAQLRQGKLKRPAERALSKGDRRIVQEWTDRLLRNHDVNVRKEYMLRFRYHHAEGYDNSVSQYAMLGLYSANLCGVKISPQVWYAAAAHWLDQVTPVDGPALRLRVTGPGQRGTAHRTAAQLPAARPARWDYFKDYNPSSSMTAAGITGVTVCRDAFARLERAPAKLRKELEQALRGGLVWLAQRFSMRAVFGDPVYHARHRDYNWFGLERAFELNQIETLQGRDWYFEGAQILLGLQRSGGEWGSLEGSCFAILFLKKATSGPLVPILQGPITPGGRR